MTDSLLIGLSALSAQQRAMEVTSHNLANATTPGYTRQRADLQASSPEDIKPGQFGRGVDLTAVRRIMDNLVNERLRQAEGESGRLDTLKTNLEVVQQAFNEPGENGLSAVIGQLFGSLEDLSNNPESVAIRSTAVQQLQTFTATLSDLGKRVSSVRDDLGVSLNANLIKVNDLTASIAKLNQQIRNQINVGNNPNDLLDSRESQLAELTNYLDVQVRYDPKDQSALVSLGGRLLVGSDNAETLLSRSTASGDLSITGASGIGFEISGGQIGALYDLHHNILPGISASLDGIAGTVAHEMNAIHATGTSDSYRANAFASDYRIASAQTGLNLDDPLLRMPAVGQPGIPKGFQPDFTDGSGTLVAKDLTINVYNPTTKTAAKFTVRWDPAQANGSRSLDDLVAAINTGTGGGFTVYPATANGVTGVMARKVQVDGGFRLELKTVDPAQSLDFSQALDLRPSAQSWTGTGAVAVSGTASPLLPTQRLELLVDPAGTSIGIGYRDPTNGQPISLGSVAVPGTGTNTVTVNGITLSVDAGTFRAGDRIGVVLDGAGNVLDPATGTPGTDAVAATWTAGDATMDVRGRYTGTLSDPALGWSAKVITAGVIGASATAAVPNNPPVVQFTYWTGTPSSPVQQVVTRTLDSSLPAGTPIALADGVYVTFGAGTLGTVGNHLDYTVDGQPDQAGLLPALGINSLFTGGESASTLDVAERIAKDPSQLGLAKTRNEGDNSNVTDLIATRKEKLFSSGAFTLDDFYAGLLTGVGVRIQQANRLSENQDALKASLSNQREQLSGVNIDEEVGKLIQQQQAYSAAARVVSTARDNIQTLLDILR